MFELITNFMLLFAGGGDRGASGFMKFYNDYLNIPGFEAWKFVNLALFIAALYWIAKKIKVSDSFKARRDQIRAELIKAEQEKQAALARLTSVEARLAQLEIEKENILQRAKEEAAFEEKRLANQTKADIVRLRQQAQIELERTLSQARAELKRFSAFECIRLAEEKLRKRIDDETDAKLVQASVAEIGGLN